jgi:hypothetical protein
MSVSPFTFYRGSAAVQAADLSNTPTTDLTVQLCGDAHLSNFGLFNGPDRRLVFDLYDFDETHPGPFEWDVKRLAVASVLEPYTAPSEFEPGQRVVIGQRMTQTTGDILMGWSRGGNEQTGGTHYYYYLRQLWDGKRSADVDEWAAAGCAGTQRCAAGCWRSPMPARVTRR